MKSIKCVVIGDKEIGKSCMLTSYTRDFCPGYYIPTLFDNHYTSIIIDGKPITLYLFDTSGSEQFDRFRPQSYPETDVILICYSVMNSLSFTNAELKWFPEAQLNCPNAKIILVATKIDLRSDETAMMGNIQMRNEKPITRNEGLDMSRRLGFFQFWECSAVTRVGLTEVFQAAANSVLFPELGNTRMTMAFLKGYAKFKRRNIRRKKRVQQIFKNLKKRLNYCHTKRGK